MIALGLVLRAAAAGLAARQVTITSRAFDAAVTAGCNASRPPSAQSDASLLQPKASHPRSCIASFSWSEETQSSGELQARVDMRGDGVIEGCVVLFDFGGVAEGA